MQNFKTQSLRGRLWLNLDDRWLLAGSGTYLSLYQLPSVIFLRLCMYVEVVMTYASPRNIIDK